MKILFVISNLEIGGTRRSLLNLLSYMSNYDVDLDLLVFSPYGAYENSVPDKIKIIKGNLLMQGHFAEKKTLNHQYKLLFYRAIGSLGTRVIGEDRFWDFVLQKFSRDKIKDDYDAVVGFQEGFSNFFTSFTHIKPRLIWIHNDYNNIPTYRTRNEEAYLDINRIFFVAETAKKSFAKAFPSLESRMSVIKNIVPIGDIRKKAQEEISEEYYQKGKINLISVGRIEKQKAFDRIIGILQRLGEQRKQINWIIVGEGSQKNIIQNMLFQNGFQDIVKFIGTRSNPYPYMAKADLFVLTSEYESQPMVIMESLITGTPVISTNFDSAYELLEDKKYGVICDNTEEGIANKLLEVVNNPEILMEMKRYTSEFTYDNNSIIEQIFNVISEEKVAKKVGENENQ